MSTSEFERRVMRWHELAVMIGCVLLMVYVLSDYPPLLYLSLLGSSSALLCPAVLLIGPARLGFGDERREDVRGFGRSGSDEAEERRTADE